MGDTIKERILEFIRYKGITMKTFENRCNLSTGYVTSMRKGFGSEKLKNVLNAFPELNREWLLYGEGEMLLDPDSSQSNSTGTLVPLVPVTALANPLGEFLGKGVRREDCQFVLSAVPGAELAIIISGDSMEPKFHDGSIVYLKQINDAAFIPWGNTLVIDTENGAFIKNVFPSDDLSIEARSINPIYPPMIIPKSSIFGMYRVLSSTKFFTTM